MSNDDSIQVNGLFTSKDKPKKSKSLQKGQTRIQKESDQVVSLFMRQNQGCSRDSNDFGFCDKI